ncbi:mechanosensitive ion channel family protein [bacterium]|nr:mechanosensitive ion channel family protein [bacterium]
MFNFNFGMPDVSLIFDYVSNFYYWLQMTNIGRFVIAVFIMLIAFIVKDFFSFLIVKLLNFLVLKKITYGQEKSLREIGQPIEFIPVVTGVYLAINVLRIPHSFVFYTRNLLKSLYIFNITWLIYSFISPVAAIFRKTHLDNTKTVIITWSVRIIKFLIFIIGASALLENWGVKVSTLIASLGLVGMAVALGAQDMFKNIISGMAIISEKRFNIGDIIKIEDPDNPIEGIVENIGFRSTMIRKFDRAPLFVPNSTLSDAAVINFSSRKYRRIEWYIALEYRTTANQLRYIRQEIERYLIENNDFVKPPESIMQVRIDKIGVSSIDLMVYCFANTNVWADWLKIREDLVLKIKEVVEEAGANFAYPSTSIYVEKVDNKMVSRKLSDDLINKIKDDKENADKNMYLFQDGDV